MRALGLLGGKERLPSLVIANYYTTLTLTYVRCI